MSEDLINQETIDKAVTMFEGQGLDAPEALLASARLFIDSLDRFRKEAPAYRAAIGETDIRRFAMEHLNEVIYDVQDSLPVALRLYNSLMRDPESPKNGPPE